jgi:hypothetical protein
MLTYGKSSTIVENFKDYNLFAPHYIFVTFLKKETRIRLWMICHVQVLNFYLI